jgi:hypothetical protein
MVIMNPYASYLGDRNPLEVITATPGQLAHFSETEGRPAPGKWNAREILCHLADCELVFAYRIRQTLAEDHHVVQPFDQERWASTYAAYDARAALAVFSSVRQWNLALIKTLKADALKKPVTHPERGTMTLQVVLETMAGHDLNHLKQLEALV